MTTAIKERVKEDLFRLLVEVFRADPQKLASCHGDEELLGAGIGFSPADLLVLFFEVEKRFNVRIQEEAIVNGRFSTLNQIAELLSAETEIEKTSELI